jgi:hypothetical protein
MDAVLPSLLSHEAYNVIVNKRLRLRAYLAPELLYESTGISILDTGSSGCGAAQGVNAKPQIPDLISVF